MFTTKKVEVGRGRLALIENEETIFESLSRTLDNFDRVRLTFVLLMRRGTERVDGLSGAIGAELR